MKRSRFIFCTAASSAILFSAPGIGMAAGERRLPGNASLGQVFVAHEYGDGFHYAFQFHRDGKLTGTEMGKDVRGTWRATNNELCWTWARPNVDEECYTVRRKGQDVMLDRDGVEEWVGSLRPVGAEKKK